MPNPFPGMDPYLEGEMWSEFHDRLANQISVQLMPLLRPKYVALLNKYFALDYSARGIATGSARKALYPDVHVAQVRDAAAVAYAPPAQAPAFSPAPPAPTELLSPLPEEVPLLNVEIRDVAERRLVTVIEILSPANKHGKGAAEYAEKRTQLLQTDTHLLEIDLLRLGARIELIGELPPASYYIFLSRAQRRPRTQVWPIPLRCALPAVPVPLLPPDADVVLDLQAALTACYELVGYERLLNYREPLSALTDDESAWVKIKLHEAELSE